MKHNYINLQVEFRSGENNTCKGFTIFVQCAQPPNITTNSRRRRNVVGAQGLPDHFPTTSTVLKRNPHTYTESKSASPTSPMPKRTPHPIQKGTPPMPMGTPPTSPMPTETPTLITQDETPVPTDTTFLTTEESPTTSTTSPATTPMDPETPDPTSPPQTSDFTNCTVVMDPNLPSEPVKLNNSSHCIYLLHA